MPSTPLTRLLARQDGLITLRQAAALGLSAQAVRRRVAGGTWQKVAPRVYLAHGSADDPAVRLRAAALWSLPDGAVSGSAAAWWLGMLDRPPVLLQVTVPRRRAPTPPPGIRVRRRDLAPEDLTRRRGVRLTAPPLTALETAAVLPQGGAAFLDRALRRQVRFEELLRAYRRALGCRGAGGMRALIVAAADRADSAAERMLFRLLREAGITGWVRALPFGRWTLDLAFPAVRLAVEVDGWAWHVDLDRFRADRAKQNALVAAGWTILRFTWHDLTGDPDLVAAAIRRVLRP